MHTCSTSKFLTGIPKMCKQNSTCFCSFPSDVFSRKNVRTSTSAVARMFDALDGKLETLEDFRKIENIWDKDLLVCYHKLDQSLRKSWETKILTIFEDYCAEVSLRYDEDKDSDVADIGIRFRKMLLSGCSDFETKCIRASIAYKITMEKSKMVSKPLDFCWNCCGDVLEAMKSAAIQKRSNETEGSDLIPISIPRHFLRRLSIDQRTLIYD